MGRRYDGGDDGDESYVRSRNPTKRRRYDGDGAVPTTTDGGTREGGGGGLKNELRGDVRERNDEHGGNEDGGVEPKPATKKERYDPSSDEEPPRTPNSVPPKPVSGSHETSESKTRGDGVPRFRRRGPRKATLQNNIGVMMLHKNSIDEARDRFHAAILASDYNNNNRLNNTTSRGYDTPTKKSITLVHADIPGLTWFHNKLQRECNSTHTATINNTNNTTTNNNGNKSSYPQVASSLSQSSSSLGQQPSSSFEHHHHHRHRHHHHHRTDIPSNVPLTVNAHHPMASWNHNIEKNVPLRLEFGSLPLHVHSTNLNTGSPTKSESAADARCAAYLNLARPLPRGRARVRGILRNAGGTTGTEPCPRRTTAVRERAAAADPKTNSVATFVRGATETAETKTAG